MFQVRNGLVFYSDDFCAVMRYDEPRTLFPYLEGHELPTARDCRGNGLLHLASQYGGGRVVEHLIGRGCRVDGRNADGNTPLILAFAFRNLGAAEVLLGHAADVTARNANGRSVLDFVNVCRAADDVRLLAEAAGARGEAEALVEMFLEADYPLHMAVLAGSARLVRSVHGRLGDAGQPMLGRTALQCAIHSRSLEVIRCLLQLGADVRGALHFAARQNSARRSGTAYRDVLKLLLDWGAEVDELSCGTRPLHMVAGHGDAAAAKLLLEFGAEATARDTLGQGVLHFAAANPEQDVLRVFLNCDNLDVNARDKRGRTPLHVASEKANLPCIKLLLDANARVNVIDSFGRTPLYDSIDGPATGRHKLDRADAVDLLLDHGADVDAPDPRGNTILSRAFDTRIGEVLVRHLAKLERLGRTIGEAHVRFIVTHQTLGRHLLRCRRELDGMRQNKVYGRVTFLELLTGDARTTAGYARNKQLEAALARSECAEKYPLYCDVLERNFARGARRHEQIAEASAKLQGSLLFSLPEITGKILYYLSNDDRNNICSC